MLSLKILRVLKGLSQRELARRAGLCSSTLCRLERGHQTASPKQLERLAAALTVTAGDLQPGDELVTARSQAASDDSPEDADAEG